MLFRSFAVGSILVASIAATFAHAQAPPAGAYKTLRVAPSLTGTPDQDNPDRLSDSQKKAKRNLSEAKRVVNNLIYGRATLAGREKQIFEYYYRNYIMPLMSKTDDASLHQLPERRVELSKDLRKASRTPAVHDHLAVNIILPQMKEFVKENFHPAVRFNAMLLIGDLNAVEASPTIEKIPPRPLSDALTFMLDELENPQQLDAVKVAALVGVLRHVDLNRQLGPQEKFINTDELKERIVNVARAIVLQKDPPPNRTPEGHVWMQRRSLEVMASAGVSGDDRSFQSALDTIADPEAPMSLRCTAASVLPKFLAVKPTVAQDVAKKLGSLTAHFCMLEIDRVEEQKKQEALRKAVELAGGARVASSGGFGGFGQEMSPEMSSAAGFGSGGNTAAAKADPRAYRINVTRRRLLYQLMCTSEMLRSMQNWTIEDPAQKAFVERVSKLVDDVVAAVTGPGGDASPVGLELASTDDLDALVSRVRAATSKLNAVTPAPKAADANDVPVFDPTAQGAPSGPARQPAAAKQPAPAAKQPAPAANNPAPAANNPAAAKQPAPAAKQ